MDVSPLREKWATPPSMHNQTIEGWPMDSRRFQGGGCWNGTSTGFKDGKRTRHHRAVHAI